MRSAEQVRRTPREYADFRALERRRLLGEALELLRRARESGAPWYRWIVDGRPELTQAEYDALERRRRK